MQTSNSEKSALFKRGALVFAGLAALTVVEYFASKAPGSAMALLFVLALAKAGLILEFFMHLGKIFQGDENGGHS